MDRKSRSSRHSIADIINPDKVRSKSRNILPTPSDISSALSGVAAEEHIRLSSASEEHPLLSFKGLNHKGVKNAIIHRLQQDSFSRDALILRRCAAEQFRIISTNASIDNAVHSLRLFPGIVDCFSKNQPLVLDSKLAGLWKPLFYYMPKSLVLIPLKIYKVRPKREIMLECIAVLAYTTQHPPQQLLDESILNKVISYYNLTAPLLYHVQCYDDIQSQYMQMSETFESIGNVVKNIQELGTCVNTICLESLGLFRATTAVAFIDVNDSIDTKLVKYCSYGGGGIHEQCPDRDCHTKESLEQKTSYPAGWSAIHKKPIRANELATLTKYCGARHTLHTIGGCIVNNVMCFVIEDLSNDMSLVIELSEKTGGFSEDDELKALLFSARISTILSTSVMLDFTKKSMRRNEITNKIINNVKTVAVKKVLHLLDNNLKYSSFFKKRFESFSFVLRKLDQNTLPNIILYMFNELDFVNRWKIRKATIIRFILSIMQGYRANPYHNWRHACTVAHFAFVLLKQGEIQKKRYLTDLEAFAFFVSCVSHDVDHKGVNSRIIDTTGGESKPNAYLFSQEEGLVQRHHLAVTMQILNSDDCNIVENMGDEDYRQFVELVQLCILATDINQHLLTREKHYEAMQQFDKHSPLKRRSLLIVLMTACNMSDTIKPWDEYILTVSSIFSEFFAQGDDEIKHGVRPNPTMNRRTAYIPQIEIKFINDVVKPAYQALIKIVPKVEDCINKLDYYEELWIVSTKVFQKFSKMQDPLRILELPDMKERQLKTMPHPELERKAKQIKNSLMSIGKMSSTALSTSQSMEFNSLSFHALSKNKISVISIKEIKSEKKKRLCKCGGPRDKTLCSRFLNRIASWRHKGIDDASIVRRWHQEDEFLEEQSHEYGKTRYSVVSAHDDDSVYKFHCATHPQLCIQNKQS